MKIPSLAFEPQDMVTPVDQITQRANQESAEHAAQSRLRIQRAETKPDDAEEISLQKLQHLTEAVDSYMASIGVSLKFNIDERTDMVQVEVRDPETDKLIRKIPADEMLDLAASIENMVGLFLDKAL
jgi:flagellar protein FlaG